MAIKKEIKEDTKNKTFSSLQDVLEDDSILFEDLGKIENKKNNFFNTKKVTRKQKSKPEKVAKRQKVFEFKQYERLFKSVQSDLA